MKHQKEGIIKGMMISMINRRLVELSNSDTPPFIGAGSRLGGTLSKYHGKFSVSASSSEVGIKTTLRHMVLELERVKRFGFTVEEQDYTNVLSKEDVNKYRLAQGEIIPIVRK